MPVEDLSQLVNNIDFSLKLFLRAFQAEVAQPVPKDGREKVEYAPTQIIADYFRWI